MARRRLSRRRNMVASLLRAFLTFTQVLPLSAHPVTEEIAVRTNARYYDVQVRV